VDPWKPEDEERVDPTVRWFMRGVWKLLLVLFVVMLIAAIVWALD
jgi:hypothetical protein